MTFPRPPLTPLAERLPASVPFVGPEAQERARGRPFVARIGANESVFGPSPKAVSVMEAAAREVWKYGDPESHDLTCTLAAQHGVGPEHIMIGEGIDGLLGLVVRLFVEPGTPVVTSDGAYPTFNYHVTGFGGTIHKVPYREDREDLDALLDLAHKTHARLIYVANPDNPMGTWHDAAAVDAMIAAMPPFCLLVLDEAYSEFAPAGACPAIDTSAPNVLRLRTFSKAFGMAGARIGYAIGEDTTIRAFHKVRNHFGVGRISQAGAFAALGDHEWLKDVLRKTSNARERIFAIAAENGLAAVPSATNFVTVDCGREGTFAKAVLDGLIARDVFVRMPFASPGNRCIRVGCGTDSDLDAFAAALPHALSDATRNAR